MPMNTDGTKYLYWYGTKNTNTDYLNAASYKTGFWRNCPSANPLCAQGSRYDIIN